MRIYATADIHGRQERLHAIRNAISFHRPDVLVLAGDITNYTRPIPTMDLLNDLPVPVLAVRGNTDPAKIETLIDNYSNITLLHLNEIIMNDTAFVGVSGTIPLPFRSRLCFRENSIIETIRPLIKKHSVLIVHPPPWGILDDAFGKFHAGCKSLRKLVSELQPRIVICGHIHESLGTAYIGETLVVNCSMGKRGTGVIIECNTQETPKVTLLP